MAEHRREIDGLRSIAVIPVILAHAGVWFIQGGFLGVDVFFVISGFLITSIIMKDIEAGRFSIVGFYQRRGRRILPALFLVMALSILPAWLLMGANALKNFGQSIVATILFSNNILLTTTSGYWETESQFKPLLHTWSLGVEEQYYTLAPLLIWGIYRIKPNGARGVFLFLAVLSFVTCLWAVSHTPVANFYLLHTRAWELALGAWAGATTRTGAARNSVALSFLGLAAIIVPMLLIQEGTATPSPITLLPVVGTMLILMYCREGACKALLAWRPLQGIGLVSYSAYLWHQPIFAFLRLYSVTALPVWIFVATIPAIFGLAYLSWRFVENPFRDRSIVPNRTAALVLGAAVVLLLAAGLLFHSRAGLPARFYQGQDPEAAGSYRPYNMAVFRYKHDQFEGQGRRLLVIGNSQARDMINMLDENHALRKYERLYRDDIDPCAMDRMPKAHKAVLGSADLVVILLGKPGCDARGIAVHPLLRGKVIFSAPKSFGDNLNPYMRLPAAARANARAIMPRNYLDEYDAYKTSAPADLFVDIRAHLSSDGATIPVFDARDNILSEDRVHLTKAGARHVGNLILADPIWARVLRTSEARRAAGRDAIPAIAGQRPRGSVAP